MSLISLLVISLIRAPGKQQTSLKSGWWMGTSVPLRRELPTTILHCLFLVALIVMYGADQAALLSSIPQECIFLFQSAEE